MAICLSSASDDVSWSLQMILVRVLTVRVKQIIKTNVPSASLAAAVQYVPAVSPPQCLQLIGWQFGAAVGQRTEGPVGQEDGQQHSRCTHTQRTPLSHAAADTQTQQQVHSLNPGQAPDGVLTRLNFYSEVLFPPVRSKSFNTEIKVQYRQNRRKTFKASILCKFLPPGLGF